MIEAALIFHNLQELFHEQDLVVVVCHMAVSHLFAAKINGPERVVLVPAVLFVVVRDFFCLLHVCVLCRILFKSLPYCAAHPYTLFCHVVLHLKLFLDILALHCCPRVDHQVFVANCRDTTKRFRPPVDVRQRLDVVAILNKIHGVLLHCALEDEAGQTVAHLFKREVRPDVENGHGP